MRALLVVTGASGVGKTSAVAALQARGQSGLNCFYFDSIGVPPPEVIERDFGGPALWQAAATRQWIHRLANEGSSTDVSVLDGQTRPSFVYAELSEVPNVRAQVVLLDCDPEVRRARLVARGQGDLATAEMDAWAAFLRRQAEELGLPVIQTSGLSVEDVADSLAEHVERLRSVE